MLRARVAESALSAWKKHGCGIFVDLMGNVSWEKDGASFASSRGIGLVMDAR